MSKGEKVQSLGGIVMRKAAEEGTRRTSRCKNRLCKGSGCNGETAREDAGGAAANCFVLSFPC